MSDSSPSGAQSYLPPLRRSVFWDQSREGYGRYDLLYFEGFGHDIGTQSFVLLRAVVVGIFDLLSIAS